METFVIRVWTPAGRDAETEPGRLRGIAEHIGSREHDAFRDADELLAFLTARLGRCTQADPLTRRPR